MSTFDEEFRNVNDGLEYVVWQRGQFDPDAIRMVVAGVFDANVPGVLTIIQQYAAQEITIEYRMVLWWWRGLAELGCRDGMILDYAGENTTMLGHMEFKAFDSRWKRPIPKLIKQFYFQFEYRLMPTARWTVANHSNATIVHYDGTANWGDREVRIRFDNPRLLSLYTIDKAGDTWVTSMFRRDGLPSRPSQVVPAHLLTRGMTLARNIEANPIRYDDELILSVDQNRVATGLYVTVVSRRFNHDDERTRHLSAVELCLVYC